MGRLMWLVSVVSACASALVLAAADVANAEVVFSDDFDEPLGERWQVVQGTWEVTEGELVHPDASGAPHARVLAGMAIREGVIEVDATPMEQNRYRFASVGLVGKYVDEEHQWWFRFGSYGAINIDGRMPGVDKIQIGSVRPECGRTYRLKIVMRGGLVGVSVDGTTMAIFRDPFADLEGRPGVFTETHARFDNFTVTRNGQ
ncbi:MAG: hypothetical protein U9R79_04970 [Armatimonadota bacterium]|nr:hypothetical protein [Armatimonadota bacterium]